VSDAEADRILAESMREDEKGPKGFSDDESDSGLSDSSGDSGKVCVGLMIASFYNI